MNLSWMAWTLPTAMFFLVISCCCSAWPSGNTPRPAAIRASACCASRRRAATVCFISLLGSAFIHLAWLGLVGPNLWWALALSVVYAIGVFRFV